MYYYITEDHQVIPTSSEIWSTQLSSEKRKVAKSYVYPRHKIFYYLGLRPSYLVSTVFLGLDHQVVEGGPPLLFETMVFPRWVKWRKKRNGWIEEKMSRYSTWDQAILGHKQMVADLK